MQSRRSCGLAEGPPARADLADAAVEGDRTSQLSQLRRSPLVFLITTMLL